MRHYFKNKTICRPEYIRQSKRNERKKHQLAEILKPQRKSKVEHEESKYRQYNPDCHKFRFEGANLRIIRDETKTPRIECEASLWGDVYH